MDFILIFQVFFGFYFLKKIAKEVGFISWDLVADTVHGGSVAGPREPTWMPTWCLCGVNSLWAGR